LQTLDITPPVNPSASVTTLMWFLLFLLLILGGCASRYAPPPRPAMPGTPADFIIQSARSKIGMPYVRGAGTPGQGFDCSGLVVWIYKKYGFQLPRTAHEQLDQGASVPFSHLQAADLVFFRIGARGAYHVGIATGQGTFIHSPRPGSKVREESLSTIYWQKRLIGVRRLI
jgi:murein DD-endopeptidase